MKTARYIAFLAAVLAIGGCDSDSADEGLTGSRQPVPIAFSADGSTRAMGVETLAGSGSAFGVFAAHTRDHYYASSNIVSDFMYNQKVSLSGGAWNYSPVKYWPNEDESYVSFFAYAPYSEGSAGSGRASGCITDFSNPGELGDPWLIYRVASTNAAQVDLLYAMSLDRKKGEQVNQRVSLHFRHALACVGDRVTVSCEYMLQQKLKALAAGQNSIVKMTLDTLTLDYTLTRKGRLVLNSDGEPNWQPVLSEDPTVHRVIRLTPAHLLARAAAGGATIETFDYACTQDASGNDLGVFYIPMNLDGNVQQLLITVDYTIDTGYKGSVSNTMTLSTLNPQGTTQDIAVRLGGGVPVSAGE